MFYRVLRENDCDLRILCWVKLVFSVRIIERFLGVIEFRYEIVICVYWFFFILNYEIKESRF